jgi:hypothetical protein
MERKMQQKGLPLWSGLAKTCRLSRGLGTFRSDNIPFSSFQSSTQQHARGAMETLDGSDWDVVIGDTGFSSSLLALYVNVDYIIYLLWLTNISPP